MTLDHKNPKFPENLFLKELVLKSGRKSNHLAKSLKLKDPITGEEKTGCSLVVFSQTINGHHKGVNIRAALLKELGVNEEPNSQPTSETIQGQSNN